MDPVPVNVKKTVPAGREIAARSSIGAFEIEVVATTGAEAITGWCTWHIKREHPFVGGSVHWGPGLERETRGVAIAEALAKAERLARSYDRGGRR